MWKIAKIVLIFVLLVIVGSTNAYVVEIENGRISGAEHNNYYAFRGIQYAIADRFELSRPFTEKWNDVREVKLYKESCAQYDHFLYDFLGSEDCLFLNVFVPKKIMEAKEPHPVIFYIHGGAFMFGGGAEYLPEHIMDNGNLILVTINYRLGILGFMSTEDDILPGNLGLKDQVEALKWVQRNIEVFNGDPKKVTLVGYSAGGASVQLHYLTSLSKGLFNNGISHSGVALNPWVFMEKARKKSYKVAELMNCPKNDHQKMIDCLKQKPVKELVKLTKHFQPFLYNPFSPFGAVIEPENDSAFITQNPRILLKHGKFNHRPWLLSQTKDEGLYPGAELYSKEQYLNTIDKEWNIIMPCVLHYNEESDDNNKINQVSKAVRDFYMSDKKVNREHFGAFNNILTDRLFKFNAFEAIRYASKYSPSYFYHFNYKSAAGLAEYMGNTTNNIGISHGEDVLLIFKHDLRSNDLTEDEFNMSQNLINMYFEFASTDHPRFDKQMLDQSKPNAIQTLEIMSNKHYVMNTIDERFGNVKFWKEMETLLQSSEKIIDEL